MISGSRSREEHDGVCSSIISFITLGSIDIQHHPDFLAVGDGFNVVLEPFAAYDQSHHVLEVRSKCLSPFPHLMNSLQWFDTPCRELLKSTYDLTIKAVSDVVAHITFAETNADCNPWDENAEIVELIKTSLIHYLTGRGHPWIPDRIVEALGRDPRDNDPLIRARLFMSVMTGYPLLPVQPLWSLKVCRSVIPHLSFFP